MGRMVCEHRRNDTAVWEKLRSFKLIVRTKVDLKYLSKFSAPISPSPSINVAAALPPRSCSVFDHRFAER